MNYIPFSSKIISWYKAHKRELPWRKTEDPYFIWISEIILQQTRVSQGLPYYEKFILNFPTINTLAIASEEEILTLWQGLGYYTRARNMHKCAKIIMTSFDSKFPTTFDELTTLPGIGVYTAAAIASLAFNKATPVVDGNVYRVLARVFGIKNNIANSKSFTLFYKLSESHINIKEPGTYNQAVMELGALLCTPKNPKCDLCPLFEICFARVNRKQKELPIKINKKKNKNRYFTYLVIEQSGKFVMVKRDGNDIWNGLYEFHLIENSKHTLISELKDILLEKLLSCGLIINQKKKLPKHLLSHQTIYSTFLYIKISSSPKWSSFLKQNQLTLYSKTEIEKLPKSTLISNYLDSYL